jgi:hypothetical protein
LVVALNDRVTRRLGASRRQLFADCSRSRRGAPLGTPPTRLERQRHVLASELPVGSPPVGLHMHPPGRAVADEAFASQPSLALEAGDEAACMEALKELRGLNHMVFVPPQLLGLHPG